MDKINLSIQLVNQVMAYLGTRPYQEVFQLVDAMQKEAQAQANTNQISTPEPSAETPAEPSAQ
jgi:hypothetical protein